VASSEPSSVHWGHAGVKSDRSIVENVGTPGSLGDSSIQVFLVIYG